LTDDLLKLFVENRVRILDALEEFVKNDIGFGRNLGGKRFGGFHAPAFENLDAERAPEASRVYFTDRYQW
jgi:hypothetical protein